MKPHATLASIAGILCSLSACADVAGESHPSASVAQDAANATGIDPDLVAIGRQVVVRDCSRCHAIDNNTSSPRADAPPMNSVLSRYDPELLVEDLIEGMRVGHDDMPVFDFNVIAADAVVAYLRSLEKQSKGR